MVRFPNREEYWMSQSVIWWRISVVAAIAMCIVFSLSATGQGKPPSLGMATVDINKIQAQYKQMNLLQTDLNVLKQRLAGQLDRRQQMPLLSEEDQKTLDAIYAKDVAAQTADDKKKIEEITNRGQALNNEFTALRQKAEKDLTDADKKRIKELEDLYVKSQQELGNLRDQSENTIKQFVTQHSEELTNNMRNAIKKIAEQKGIAIVFTTEIAPYAGTDITDQVIAELNKK